MTFNYKLTKNANHLNPHVARVFEQFNNRAIPVEAASVEKADAAFRKEFNLNPQGGNVVLCL